MIKKISFVALILLVIFSCVSPKVYKDLEGKYNDLKKENRNLSDENETLLSAKNKAENSLKILQKDYDEAVAQRDKLQSDFNALKSNHENLKASYDALEREQFSSYCRKCKKEQRVISPIRSKGTSSCFRKCKDWKH